MTFCKQAIPKIIPYEVGHRRFQNRKTPHFKVKMLSTPYIAKQEGHRFSGLTGKLEIQYPWSAARWFHKLENVCKVSFPGLALVPKLSDCDDISITSYNMKDSFLNFNLSECLDASDRNTVSHLEKIITKYQSDVIGQRSYDDSILSQA